MSRSTEPRPTRRAPLRRALAVLTALLLGLAGAFVAVPASAAPGDVTGHVVDQYGNDVVGLDFTLYDTIGGSYPVTTAGDGTFLVNVTPTPSGYFYYNVDDELDALGYGYAQQSNGDFLVGTLDFGQIVLERYENVAGTITNWDASMVSVEVDVFFLDAVSGHWQSVGHPQVTTDGTFSVPAILADGYYTVYFGLDPTSTAPYLSAMLGGEFYDFADSDVFYATAGTPQSITMAMPAAALVSGRVTTGGGSTPLPGIYVVSAEDLASSSGDYAVTDANGDYTLRVRPGATYMILAADISGDPDPYAVMIYDGFYGCSCQFTPVVSTSADPADGIDFDLTRESELFFILGELYDTDIDTGDELEGIRVHVQRQVSGVWTDIAIAESDASGQFEVVVPRDDLEYRLVFDDHGTVLRIVEGEVGPGSAASPDLATPGCSLATGQADPSWLDSGVLYYVVLGLNPDGGCDSTPPPSGTPGAQPGRPRTATVSDVVPAVAPTPTPTPTPSATPRPSTSPEPETTGEPEATPASAPDLSWLLWVGIALLVILLVGGGILVLRRR